MLFYKKNNVKFGANMEYFSKQLKIRRGITAIIGGGGKTTLLYRLAQELSQAGSVIVATSTHIWKPEHLQVETAITQCRGIVCVGTPCENGKLSAPQQSFSELAELADYVLVEADGSAGKPLKAHATHEPVIPVGTNQVILVIGCSGIGEPISVAAHRPARYAALCGCDETALVTPRMAARVAEAERLHHRVLLNQADTPERLAAARELGAALSCPGIIGAVQKGEIICSF